MENISFEFSLYVGKVGVDNFLLMAVGVLFGILYLLKRQEANFARFSLYLAACFHFVSYSIFFDAYRFKILRKYLLWGYSFTPYKTVTLLISLLPLYTVLIDSILRILIARHKKNS